jgi:acyl-CoA hydrolase
VSDAPLIVYADGADGPCRSPHEIAALVGVSPGDVLLGFTPESRPWLDESSGVRGRTVLGGYALTAAIRRGQLDYVPVRLSAVAALLHQSCRPYVLVLAGVRRGRDVAFRGSVGWALGAIAEAEAVVVEVDEHAADLGAPLVPGPFIEIAAPADRPRVPNERALDHVDLAVARNVVSMLPEEPTIQYGIGAMGEAVIAALDRPVRVWSGMVTDGLADLAERGLLLGTATCAYTWAGEPLATLAAAGRVRLVGIEETHDPSLLAAQPRFVAVNAALQVGLDGTVNVERVGGRIVAGAGGHPDFCVAAARNPDGLSVIALRSTRGDRSNIVPVVETASTPRCDIDLVVTEHGVADLRGVDDRERARRITAVAAPGHRDRLAAATRG